MKSLVIFTNDLRLNDNDAINSSIKEHESTTFIFIYDIKLYSNTHGSANLWWLGKSLEKLKNRLQKKGINLYILQGGYVDKTLELVEKYNFQSVFINENKHPDFVKKEKELKIKLNKINVNFFSYNKSTLSNPEKILNKSGEPYRVYTPFYNFCKSIYSQKAVLFFPSKKIKTYDIKEYSIDPLEILAPLENKWSLKFDKHWVPGEEEAERKIKNFFSSSLSNYKIIRNIPGKLGTSKMSPHLRFGEITTNQIINYFNFHANHTLNEHEEHFIKELYWREYSYYILFHYPYVINKPFNKKYEDFEWETNYQKNFSSWKNGSTGIRIVDAAMHELWETGWMHNRTRMITASFLTKNLLIPWQEGEKWFRDTLVDADIASNVMGWQWVAGSGTDAAPYFRIFNPVLQDEKFDPDNTYTKKWLKNFSSYKNKEAVDLLTGKDFIEPIVDLKISRNIALERFSKIK